MLVCEPADKMASLNKSDVIRLILEYRKSKPKLTLTDDYAKGKNFN